MDIQYAILGFLNWRPLSGYDLKKLIAESELFYWSGNNNQIYNSLIHLHKEGWVTQQVEYQESLPARKIYSITDEGRARLRGWQAAAPELPEFHNPFLIQLAWSDLLSTEEVDQLLARYAEEVEVQLRMRRAEALRLADAPQRTPREAFLWRKIHENLTAKYQHELDWVRQVQAELTG
jgi:PadR family transcriptional regulator, regulatory protein AphA